MKELQKNKNTIAIVIIFAAAIFIYKTFAPSVNDTDPAAPQDVGADLVALFATLQKVKLDQSVFNSPTYKSLSDFSQPITPQPLGRPNPFDIIGRD